MTLEIEKCEVPLSRIVVEARYNPGMYVAMGLNAGFGSSGVGRMEFGW